MKKYRKLLFIILIPISMILTNIAKNNPDLTEKYFSLGFYKYYSQIISTIMGIFPFSVAELLMVFGSLTIIGTLIYSIIKSIKSRKFTSIINYLMNISVAVSLIWFFFTIGCGLNYYRYDFTYYYMLENEITEVDTYTPEQLKDMIVDYIAVASEIRETMTDDDFNVTNAEMSYNAEISFNNFAEEYDVMWTNYSSAKSLILSGLVSYTQITGFFFPYTIEANVNTDIPTYTIPAVMLHEQAHQRGFMQENEANFIAFLAGKNSDDALTKYSAYMTAIAYALNSLYSADYDLFVEAYYCFSDLQLEDRLEKSEYWDEFKDQVVSDTFETVNDTYLKNNGQEQGVISYGEVTELLLLDYYK